MSKPLPAAVAALFANAVRAAERAIGGPVVVSVLDPRDGRYPEIGGLQQSVVYLLRGDEAQDRVFLADGLGVLPMTSKDAEQKPVVGWQPTGGRGQA